MEKSKRDLESLCSSQKEQLLRYETRLKDVVTAYKGLLKEKEALEAALTSPKEKEKTSEDGKAAESTSTSSESSDALQLQIATLMNSLATLSAEKSRMEQSFQADKRQLRQELVQKDKTIAELQEKVNESGKQVSTDVENLKSKLIVERHEREKETNNHMVMIRELQKLYSDERHLKENLEMQLNDLKTQFSSADHSGGGKVKQLTAELKEAREKLRQIEARTEQNTQPENASFLQQLQNEMHHLKQQHAIAIKQEQKRAHLAEERNKKLAALHEDRVANLEARLAELSSTVGTYDRLRQQDQESIQKLKEKIAELGSDLNVEKSMELPKPQADIASAVDEIVRLKKFILVENARAPNPVDVSKIFNIGSDHTGCIEDISRLQTELDSCRRENDDLKQAADVQKTHIRTLQEKVKVLNRNIDEQETELRLQGDKLNHALKVEKSKWKEALNSLENEYRSKLNDMEQQLQKQRVRSLQLLDEKENEIKTLKTSFEVFVPHQALAQPVPPSDDSSSDERSRKTSTSQFQAVLGAGGNSSGNLSAGENCHMLHYANEIARKDVEITSLRKAKYAAETALRQALQDKVTSQEELCEKIANLEEQVDRLERCKTREGANLEYLKNVIISFISTRNVEGKRHMINAIGAVLQFTPAESKAINSMFSKK